MSHDPDPSQQAPQSSPTAPSQPEPAADTQPAQPDLFADVDELLRSEDARWLDQVRC
jgi:hypothetical protein